MGRYKCPIGLPYFKINLTGEKIPKIDSKHKDILCDYHCVLKNMHSISKIKIAK